MIERKVQKSTFTCLEMKFEISREEYILVFSTYLKHFHSFLQAENYKKETSEQNALKPAPRG